MHLLLAIFDNDIWWSRIKGDSTLVHIVSFRTVYQIMFMKHLLKKIVLLLIASLLVKSMRP